MTSKTKCVICRTSAEDTLNLGEMKTFKNISAHYYCLLLASTIKQSGEDEEGILGFLPSDIREEIKLSQKRTCVYCKRKGAAVLCSLKSCKAVFHLPCGIENNSGHQFHGRFVSHCPTHRRRQKFKIPTETQTCPVCYESIDFERWPDVLWAPCCKKQSFFHKKCLQQMALSAGYFFKCPMCNNSEVFQKTMKHFGVFIPDRDASWELEPNAFQELLYRHRECNAKRCLCRSGRKYDNLGPWNIVLCSMCGSQGTHINCSSLKKNQDWICDLCFIEKRSGEELASSQLNGGDLGITEPSTSNTQPPQITSNTSGSSKPKKRKRNRSRRGATPGMRYSNLIEIDSEDSDVVVIDDEPTSKCLIGQDRSLLKVPNNKRATTRQQCLRHDDNLDIENQDSSSCTDFMNLVITDVRSLSESKDNFCENKLHASVKAATNEFNKLQNNKIMYPITSATDQQHQHQQQQQQESFFVLQQMVYNNNNKNNNNISLYEESSTNSNSSDDIVIID